MTDIRFYHMQQKKLEQVLPEIVAKAREREFRIVVKLGSRERVEVMDTTLWTFNPASFVPHGYAKDGFEAEQPVWLTTEDDNPNAATMLVLADGATSDKVPDYALCCEIFDGNDEDAVTAARARWTSYKSAGHELSYFQQDDNGRWEKKA